MTYTSYLAKIRENPYAIGRRKLTPNQDNFSNTAAETLKSLENLISESLQIYELYNQKENITDDLVNSLRIITEYLSFSVNIHPGIFGLSTQIPA